MEHTHLRRSRFVAVSRTSSAELSFGDFPSSQVHVQDPCLFFLAPPHRFDFHLACVVWNLIAHEPISLVDRIDCFQYYV